MKRRFIRVTIFLICILLIVNLSRSLVDLWKKGDSLDQEEERFAKARFENEELTRESEKLQSPEYIEREARDKLGLAREGETVVVIPEITQQVSTTTNQTEEISQNTVWRQWLDFLLN